MPRRLLLLVTGLLLLTADANGECPPTYSLKWGGRGTGIGHFDHPTAGVTEAAGNLYVVDSWNNRIQKFSPDGSFLMLWGSGGSGSGQFNRPSGIAMDAAGNVYVADTGNSRIQKFTSDGVYLATIGTPGSGRGELLNPQGVDVGDDGIIYVADTGNNRVHKFAADGSFMRYWGPGSGNVVVFHSISVTSNRLFVTDTRNRTILGYTTDGQLVTGMGLGGSGGQIHIATDSQNRVHVPTGGCGTVNVYDFDGVLELAYGSNIDCILGFGSSGGIAVNDDFIYFIDGGWSSVYKFSRPDTCSILPPPWVSSEPRLLLHIDEATSKNACLLTGPADCRSIVTDAGLSTPEGPFYNVYLLATRGPLSPLRGLQCGITYETGSEGDEANGTGVDVFGWTLCADLEFITTGPNEWPAPGGGNLITWVECQQSQLAVAGYFYVGAYGTDEMRITVRPVDGLAKVADCGGAESEISAGNLGYVAFGAGQTVCNPCLTPCNLQPIPVQRITWSGIKALY
jgi:hypothetical protein